MSAKKLEYWMLNIIHDALQKEYDRYIKSSDINRQLSVIVKNRGVGFAKECEKEVQENRFHPLGKIWQSMKRIEEMRNEISDLFYLNKKP